MKRYLLDSNVLVYALDEESEYHSASLHLLQQGLNEEFVPYVSVQNLYELYAVITDKRKVSAPLAAREAVALIEKNFINAAGFSILFPDSDVLKITFEYLQTCKISAVDIFDVVLAATIIGNNIDGIVTYDKKHFQKYDFEVIVPE